MNAQTLQLPSGLRILFCPNDTQVAYLGFAINVGTRDEGRTSFGMAHFIEHMLFKGTPRYTSLSIIDEIEGVGGELNAYTTKEETMLYCTVPQTQMIKALDLLFDIVCASHMPEEEISKEQTVIIDEIASYEDSPSELIFDEFENMLFASHPLGHHILGTERSVSRFTRKRLLRFFAQHYRPNNMVLFVHGQTTLEAIVQRVASSTKAMPAFRQVQPVALPLPKPCLRRKDTHQRHVLIGGYAYPRGDKRKLELSVLVNYLGGSGMNSRLNMALRERCGLVYHIECSYTAYADTGFVAIYFGCTPKYQKQAMALVEEELQLLRTEQLDDEALNALKQQIKGQLLLANEHKEHTLLALAKHYLHDDEVLSLEETNARLDQITVEDLHRVANEIFAPDRLTKLIYT